MNGRNNGLLERAGGDGGWEGVLPSFFNLTRMDWTIIAQMRSFLQEGFFIRDHSLSKTHKAEIVGTPTMFLKPF